MANYKSTMIRTNARFRGQTESLKYLNTMNEAVHDLSMLGKIIDHDNWVFDPKRGQSDFIYDNFATYMNSAQADIHANIDTATELYGLTDNLGVAAINSSDWVTHGDCIKSSDTNGDYLQTTGGTTPAGVGLVMDVVEGQIIYLRFKAWLNTGSVTTISVGSDDINQGEGLWLDYTVPSDNSAVYIEQIFRCKHKESITINIDIAHTDALTGAAYITELEMYNMENGKYHLQPLNTYMKSSVNALEDKIKNIIKYM